MPTQTLESPPPVAKGRARSIVTARHSGGARGFAPSAFVDRLRRRLLIGQLGAMLVLGVLHAIFIWPGPGAYPRILAYLFDLDREMNLPTWFASSQLMFVALTLAAIAVASDGRRRWSWGCLAVAALYLSADEVALFHERMGTLLEEMIQRSGPESSLRSLLHFPSYYWMVAYAPFVALFAVLAGRFLWRETAAARRMLLLGVFVYLYAAVGLDFIEGHYGNPDHSPLVFLLGSHPFRFDIFMMEELLEMLGVALVLNAFLYQLGWALNDDGHGKRPAAVED